MAPPCSTASSPESTKSTPSAFAFGSGADDPPPGPTSTMYCENVSAKPVKGRASTQHRVRSQCGSGDVTMSRRTVFGIMT